MWDSQVYVTLMICPVTETLMILTHHSPVVSAPNVLDCSAFHRTVNTSRQTRFTTQPQRSCHFPFPYRHFVSESSSVLSSSECLVLWILFTLLLSVHYRKCQCFQSFSLTAPCWKVIFDSAPWVKFYPRVYRYNTNIN